MIKGQVMIGMIGSFLLFAVIGIDGRPAEGLEWPIHAPNIG